MGCFDTVLLPCPKCGELYDAQSKGGDCLLKVYYFENAPDDVMSNVNRHAPFVCFGCGTKFKVKFDLKPEIVETDEIFNDFPSLPDNATVDDITKAFEKYVLKIDKK